MNRREKLRVAISVNGEGRGHLTRMTAVARRLERRHELAFWCPDSIREELERAFPRSPVSAVPGLRFEMNGSDLDYAATAVANLPALVAAGATLSMLAAELERFAPDGLVSDFEPFLPEAAARLGIPVLQLNHPGIVTRFTAREPAALLTSLVVSRMMGRFDRLLLSSFYGGDVGPIIRPEILKAARFARRSPYVLVYAREGMAERFRDILGRRGRGEFRFFPDPRADFPAALAGCRAVVAPAGHQIMGEALHLRKPIFAVPFSGQYEQHLNAEMLARSGRGAWASADCCEEPLLCFLSELDSYPRRPDPAIAFRLCDDGPRAVRLVEDFFRSTRRAERRARRYLRVTWPLGRVAPIGAPA